MAPGKLDVHVLSARDLKDTQTFGTQDPYFIIQLGNSHFVSKVASDGGKSPVWNERFVFEVEFERTLLITLKNKNQIATDSLIGTVELDLEPVFTTGKLDARPQVITNSGQVRGELQVLLLFEGKVKKDKKGQQAAQAVQPGAPMPYGVPSAPGAGYPMGPPQQYGTPAPVGYGYGAPPMPTQTAAPYCQAYGSAPPQMGYPGAPNNSQVFPPAYPGQQAPQGQAGFPSAATPGGFPPQASPGGFPPAAIPGGFPPAASPGGFPPAVTPGGFPPTAAPAGYPPAPGYGGAPAYGIRGNPENDGGPVV